MNDSFASRLKKLREEHGLSQTELADKLGISRGSISFYENKSRVPDINILLALCNHFFVSSDYLIGLTDDPKQVPTATQDTGLSYSAIDRLNAWHTRYPDGQKGLDALSRLIVFSEFFHLLVVIQSLFSFAASDDSVKSSAHRPPKDAQEQARNYGYQLVSNSMFRRTTASLIKDEFGDIVLEIVKSEERKAAEKYCESMDVDIITSQEMAERFLEFRKKIDKQNEEQEESAQTQNCEIKCE